MFAVELHRAGIIQMFRASTAEFAADIRFERVASLDDRSRYLQPIDRSIDRSKGRRGLDKSMDFGTGLLLPRLLIRLLTIAACPRYSAWRESSEAEFASPIIPSIILFSRIINPPSLSLFHRETFSAGNHPRKTDNRRHDYGWGGRTKIARPQDESYCPGDGGRRRGIRRRA